MNNDMNDILEKWSVQKMDDVHFPRMPIWSDQQEFKLFKRILLALRRVFINLQCRLKALNPAPDFALDEEKNGLEACS